MSNGRLKRGQIKAPPQRKKDLKKMKNVKDGEREFKQRKWVATIIELMKEGYSQSYIKSMIASDKVANIGFHLITEYTREAYAIINEEYVKKTASVTSIHVARYNRIIKDLIKTKELDKDDIDDKITWEQWLEARNRKIKAFNDCLDTMLQKERCLQLHSKTFVIEINEEVNINVHSKPLKFDIKKLSFPDQLSLLQLIQKAKKGEPELISVSAAKEVDENVVDVEAVEVSSVLNVDEIAHTEPVVPKYKGELVADPTAKLKAALAKIAEAKLNRDNKKTGIKVIHQDGLIN